MTQKIVQQGAEAKIFLDEKNNLIIKDRIKKSYRHPELDRQIRKRRTKSETKLLQKAAQIIDSPLPDKTKEFDKIFMQYIKGKKLSEHLDKFPLKEQKTICKEIGKSIAKLHKNDIIHGDLTTSNMILSSGKIFFIDFGLGFISRRAEDKAVDLHLLKEALEAKHFRNWEFLLEEVFNSYKKILGESESQKVFGQLKKVEKRGRYRF